jgi:membrane protease YdiL (CAAX protease family)
VQHSRPGQNGEVRLALLALLLVVLGLLVWRAATRSRSTYRRFKRLTTTRARQKVYGRWLLESALVMGGLSAAVLLAAVPFVRPVLGQTQSWQPVAAAREFLGTPVGVIASVVALLLVVAVLIVPVLLLRSSVADASTEGGGIDAIPAVGDIRALLPRTRAELSYGVGLALSAGIFEEVLFRLGLPALLFGILGLGPLSFVVAAVLFGMLHLYQGPLGILFAALLGLVFAALYVLTGSIAAPIVLHTLVDLRSLVLIPVAVGGVWRCG